MHPIKFANAHILIVEDVPVNREILRLQLQRLGCQVVDEAANGSEALERFQRYVYDIVFMDCQMPIMDGYQATEILRQQEARQVEAPQPQHTIIIAFTAYTAAGHRARCLAVGMDDFLLKPVSTRSLEAVLTRWLTQRAIDTDNRSNRIAKAMNPH